MSRQNTLLRPGVRGLYSILIVVIVLTSGWRISLTPGLLYVGVGISCLALELEWYWLLIYGMMGKL